MSFKTNWHLSINNDLGLNAYLSDLNGYPLNELYKKASHIEKSTNLCIDHIKATTQNKNEAADAINKLIAGILNDTYGVSIDDVDKSIKEVMKSASNLSPRCKIASLQWNDRECINPIKTAFMQLEYTSETNQEITKLLDAKIVILDIYEGSIAQCIEEGQLALSELHNDSLAS